MHTALGTNKNHTQPTRLQNVYHVILWDTQNNTTTIYRTNKYFIEIQFFRLKREKKIYKKSETKHVSKYQEKPLFLLNKLNFLSLFQLKRNNRE